MICLTSLHCVYFYYMQLTYWEWGLLPLQYMLTNIEIVVLRNKGSFIMRKITIKPGRKQVSRERILA